MQVKELQMVRVALGMAGVIRLRTIQRDDPELLKNLRSSTSKQERSFAG